MLPVPIGKARSLTNSGFGAAGEHLEDTLAEDEARLQAQLDE